MTDLPSPEPTDEAAPVAEAPALRSRKRFYIGAVVVLAAGAAAFLAFNGGDEGPAALSTEGLIRSIQAEGYCQLGDEEYAEDATVAPETTTEAPDPVIEAGWACAGLEIEAASDGWHITTAPEDFILLYGDLEEALGVIGDRTGCWGSIEVSKIVGTRSLDGRVESANGRASWTYHPDNGLDIICTR